MYNGNIVCGGRMKRFIKKHRYTLVLLLIFILLGFLAIKVKDILVPDEGKATYGDRLKGIEKYPITNETYEKIEEDLKNNKNVLKSSHRLQGKVLNYFITVDSKVSVKDAKEIGNKLVTLFDEDLLSFYSIQIYVNKEDESLNNFPIMGFKDPLSKSVSWTKDREITKSDQNEK